MRRRFFLPVAVGATALAFGLVLDSAAAGQDVRTGRAVIPLLRVGWTSGRATLDPAKSYGAFQFPIYDHLLQFGPTGRLAPDLATSVSQPNPATYVFQLRHGVMFWDGTELTSADVVNALTYERVPSKSPDNVAAYLRDVKSIAAKGRYTVVVVLSRAVAYALNRADLITAAGTPAASATTLILTQQLRTLGSSARVNALLRSLPSYPYNVTAAKREMAQSAYPHGFTASLNTCQFGPLVPVSEAIAGQLKPIGIDLKVNSSCPKFSADLTNAKTPIVYTDFVNPIPDPSTWPTTFLGSKNTPPSGYNVANYTPAGVDTLLAAGLAATNPAKRLAIYAKLLERLAADVPYLVLFTEDSTLALSDKFAWPTFNYLRYDRNFWPLDIKPK
jgi:ABC-type transport system substrate-binding protein